MNVTSIALILRLKPVFIHEFPIWHFMSLPGVVIFICQCVLDRRGHQQGTVLSMNILCHRIFVDEVSYTDKEVQHLTINMQQFKFLLFDDKRFSDTPWERWRNYPENLLRLEPNIHERSRRHSDAVYFTHRGDYNPH